MLSLKSYSYNTHQGPFLELNEDGVEVDLENKLFVLLDGFGGSNIGDQAVKLVLETIKKFYTRIGGDPDSTMPFYFSPKYLLEGNALINSMHYAHSLLKEKNIDKSMSERGGASGVAISLGDNILTIASCGKALALLYRDEELTALNLPDTFSNFDLNSKDSDNFSSPLSAFGLFDELHLSVKELKLKDGDEVLLLTDGVYSRLTKDQITQVLSTPDDSSSKIDKLFKLSNEEGNQDNQSSILIKF